MIYVRYIEDLAVYNKQGPLIECEASNLAARLLIEPTDVSRLFKKNTTALRIIPGKQCTVLGHCCGIPPLH